MFTRKRPILILDNKYRKMDKTCDNCFEKVPLCEGSNGKHYCEECVSDLVSHERAILK